MTSNLQKSNRSLNFMMKVSYSMINRLPLRMEWLVYIFTLYFMERYLAINFS